MTSKKSEEKRFFQLSPETIPMLAETVGISGNSVHPNVSRALAEDVSYRCRELVSLCAQFMRHGKKKKLTCQDMERALKWYEAPQTLGHQNNEAQPAFVPVPDSLRPQETIYAVEEDCVDLFHYGLGTDLSDKGHEQDLTCEASWMAVEGHVIEDGEGPSSNISQPLLQYYTDLVGSVLSDAVTEKTKQVLLDDLRSNSKISPLLPLIVTFIGNAMQRHNDNEVLVFRLLTLIEALFINPHLNLSPKPYLSHLVTALLSTLMSKEDKPGSAIIKKNVHYAAQIISIALDRWATSVNQLRSQTHKALRDHLCDQSKSLSSHYGAMSAFLALEPAVLRECVLPFFDRYLTWLETLFKPLEANINGHLSEKSKHKRLEDVNLLWGTSLQVARALLKQEPPRSQVYHMLLRHFGDAVLTVSLPRNQRLTWPDPDCPGRLKIRGFSHPLAPRFHSSELEEIFGNGLIENSHNNQPLALSSSVKKVFETSKDYTVHVNPKIKFSVRALKAWPAQRLKCKRLLNQPGRALATSGCFVGKRLGRSLTSRSDRQRKLCQLSCALSTVL